MLGERRSKRQRPLLAGPAWLEVSFSLDLRKIAVKVPLTSPALP